MATVWDCPRCPAAAQTVTARTPHHPCPGFAGLMVPLVRVGERVGMHAVDRPDYVGRELVQCDANGRPVMSVVTEHDDGSQDCTVYPPTATADSD